MKESDLESVLQNGHSEGNFSSLLQSYHLHNLAPVTKVSYMREALIGEFEKDTRITFDSDIMGSFQNVFHTRSTPDPKYLISPMYYVLEIKTADAIPSWLSHLIERFDLELTSFSKYSKALENCGIINKIRGHIYD